MLHEKWDLNHPSKILLVYAYVEIYDHHFQKTLDSLSYIWPELVRNKICEKKKTYQIETQKRLKRQTGDGLDTFKKNMY